MTNDTKNRDYIPLTRIVSSDEGQEIQQSSLSAEDLVRVGKEFEQRIAGIESTVFNSRQQGHFLFFPSEVLGMDRAYKILTQHSVADASLFCTAVTFGYTLAGIRHHITMPDQPVMDSLQKKLDTDAYKGLQDFYAGLKAAANERPYIDGYLSISIEDTNNERHRWRRDLDPSSVNARPEMTHNFTNIPIYYNGSRMPTKDHVHLHHGDIVRIGESIVFGYAKIDPPKESPAKPEDIQEQRGMILKGVSDPFAIIKR